MQYLTCLLDIEGQDVDYSTDAANMRGALIRHVGPTFLRHKASWGQTVKNRRTLRLFFPHLLVDVPLDERLSTSSSQSATSISKKFVTSSPL